jgi:hypothetical protein
VKLAIITLMLSLLSISSQGSIPSGMAVQPLIRISSNQSTAVSNFSALVNTKSGTLEGFHMKTTDGFEDTYWLKDVERSSGVTLIERKGYEVLKIQGRLDRLTQQGKLKADYLVNAVWGSRAPCEFELKKNPSGWFIRSLFTKKQVTKVNVVAGSVGIKQLDGLCPAEK